MTNHEIWQQALTELEEKVTKTHYHTWFRNTTIIASSNGEITIAVPNKFTKEWLQKKYNKEIFKTLQHVTDNGIRKISYEIGQVTTAKSAPTQSKSNTEKPATPTVTVSNSNPPSTQSSASSFDSYKAPTSGFYPGITPQQQMAASNLNPKYVFENFVVGSNNELARAACLAVGSNLGSAYNPLFIYGGVGLGKTHLLQAIGNEVIRKDPSKKVKYVSSETFTNEVVEAIRNGTMNSFKDKYRQVDLLIIDDVQFLATKEKTQEEFFYTFNALYQSNKQVVISSDRPPKAIPTLEERLRSRFEGGMIADISAPDFETRVAILQKKLIERNFHVHDEVTNYIASNIQNNVRELEGAINRVVAHCQTNNIEPSLTNVKDLLANVISQPSARATTIPQVIETAADFYSITPKDIIGKSRKKEIVRPRQIAMYLIREEIKASFPLIGKEMGGKDHTTAMHAYQKIKKEIQMDEGVRQEVELIKQRVYGNA